MIELTRYQQNLAEIFILVVISIGSIWLMTPHASAEIITLGQGDTAYMNETVDLSLVASWPDYQLAWCANDEPGCGNPIVYDLSNASLHHVWLNPGYFRYGNYFRWDGRWNRGENLFAMTIRSGNRPVYIENKTIETVTDEDIVVRLPNKTHILIARGDPIVYKYHVEDEYAGYPSYIWLFHRTSSDGIVLGSPMPYNANEYVYVWRPGLNITRNLKEGEYTGYIQYSGGNGRQDVFIRNNHSTGDERHTILDTNYDDDLVPDIIIDGLTPSIIKSKLDSLYQSKYLDDTFIPVTMEVVAPTIEFVDYGTTEESIIVSGTTTMANGTSISIFIDPDRYKLKQDIRLHSWKTDAMGDIDVLRGWNATLNIDWSKMAVGVHTILAKIERDGIKTEVYKDFKVTDVYVMPTPTPARERVVVEEYGWHRITPIPVNTPTKIVTTAEPTPITSSHVIVINDTENKTVNTVTTTAKVTPNKTVTPKETIPTIPVNPIVGIVALLIISLRTKL